MKNTFFNADDNLAHFIGIDFENLIFGPDMGFAYLTDACLEWLLCDPQLGLPVAYINLSSVTAPMTGIVYRDGSVTLWPCTPKHLINRIGRLFKKDVAACARANAKRFKTKRNLCFYIGKNLQVMPAHTSLPGDGTGNSYVDRIFFN